jgi:hypothetical protein
MTMTGAEREDLAQLLVRVARGIAAALGRDPDDPDVDQVIRDQFRDGHEWLVIQQAERDVSDAPE